MFEPGNKLSGSRKGVKNKLTREVKESIEIAFDIVGGPAYLVRQAHENPVAFMSLLGKVIPRIIVSENTHMMLGLAELLQSIPDKTKVVHPVIEGETIDKIDEIPAKSIARRKKLVPTLTQDTG